jgi:hypothetical protein
MPSPETATAPPSTTEHTPAGACASPAFQLAQASRALWSATLSLMTAFMQVPAPAHRYLLARRISRNLDTLSRQDCFDGGCRARFARLSSRWQARSEQFAPEPAPRSSGGLLNLFS